MNLYGIADVSGSKATFNSVQTIDGGSFTIRLIGANLTDGKYLLHGEIRLYSGIQMMSIWVSKNSNIAPFARVSGESIEGSVLGAKYTVAFNGEFEGELLGVINDELVVQNPKTADFSPQVIKPVPTPPVKPTPPNNPPVTPEPPRKTHQVVQEIAEFDKAEQAKVVEKVHLPVKPEPVKQAEEVKTGLQVSVKKVEAFPVDTSDLPGLIAVAPVKKVASTKKATQNNIDIDDINSNLY